MEKLLHVQDENSYVSFENRSKWYDPESHI